MGGGEWVQKVIQSTLVILTLGTTKQIVQYNHNLTGPELSLKRRQYSNICKNILLLQEKYVLNVC